MAEEAKYNPHLPDNKKYIRDVADAIQQRAPMEEIRFEYLTNALFTLGFSENPYLLVSMENFNSEPLKELVQKSFEKVSSMELTPEIKSALFLLWDYLAGADTLTQSDLIFVFGGPGIHRAHEAIRLWKEGFGAKILFTGRHASYMENVEVTEAEYYASVARESGIPEHALLLETAAKNTPENVVNSIALLRELGDLPKKIILITLAYHMRRSYLTFKSVAEWEPSIVRYPVPSAKYTRENYFKDSNGWSYVFFEYIKIYGARLMKHF